MSWVPAERQCCATGTKRRLTSRTDEVLNRKELLSFHGDLKLWLLQNGLDANVNSGITVEQGGNRTVAELKQEREQQREQQHTTTHEHEF